MIIAFDIDGTLVNDKKEISKYTYDTLVLLKELGHTLIPCSGRSYKDFPIPLLDKKLIEFAITANGTIIYDAINNHIIDSHHFESGDFLKIIDIFENYDADIDYICDGKYYSDIYSLEHLNEYCIPNNMHDFILKSRIPVTNIKDDILNNDRHVNRANILFKDSKYRDYFLNNKKDYSFNITSSMPYNLEIMPRDISKKTGLDFFKNYFKLENKDIIFFGDALNDYEALASDYETVLMSNGFEELKCVAKYITIFDNNHDGLARFIRDYLKLNN